MRRVCGIPCKPPFPKLVVIPGLQAKGMFTVRCCWLTQITEFADCKRGSENKDHLGDSSTFAAFGFSQRSFTVLPSIRPT